MSKFSEIMDEKSLYVFTDDTFNSVENSNRVPYKRNDEIIKLGVLVLLADQVVRGFIKCE